MNARLGQWAETIQAWGFFKLVRVIEPLAILIAFVAFFNELKYANSWEAAYRDEELACGAERPIPPAPAPAKVIPHSFAYYGLP